MQHYDIIQHLDGQPLQNMIKDKASGGYLCESQSRCRWRCSNLWHVHTTVNLWGQLSGLLSPFLSLPSQSAHNQPLCLLHAPQRWVKVPLPLPLPTQVPSPPRLSPDPADPIKLAAVSSDPCM